MTTVRLVKISGRYFLVGEGIYVDVTETLEKEWAARRSVELALAQYAKELEHSATSRAAELGSKFSTLRRHVVVLLGLANSCIDSWRKGDENVHGRNIQRLESQVEQLKAWLQQVKE